MNIDPTLPDYVVKELEKQIKTDYCKWCKTDLRGTEIHFYPHPNGWFIRGFGKVWLYKICPKCDYEWALWKLGVRRK